MITKKANYHLFSEMSAGQMQLNSNEPPENLKHAFTYACQFGTGAVAVGFSVFINHACFCFFLVLCIATI